MSTAALVELQEAIVQSLNDGVFSKAFTAERGYLPGFNLTELSGLKVTIVPKSASVAKASRESAYIDPTIDIAVQQKVGTDGEGEVSVAMVDGLIALVEEIMQHLRKARLTGAPHAVWLSISNEPIYDREHMEEHHVFTSVVSVTYRTRR